MKKYLTLTLRNCKMYVYSKGNVFFSVLSMLIVLLVMGVFLGNMNVSAVTELLKEYGGERNIAADTAAAENIVRLWTMAGIIMTNSVMVSLTLISNSVDDNTHGRAKSLYCAPVERFTVSLSYITSAVIMSSFACLLTTAVSLIYNVICGGTMLSPAEIAGLLGVSLLSSCLFSSIMYAVSIPIKSSGAWSGFGTVTGTLVGFLGAIYVPIGSLPDAVAEILRYLPFMHITSLLRKISCSSAVESTFAGLPTQVADGYNEAMGITVKFGGSEFTDGAQFAFIGLFLAVALAIIIITEKKKNTTDR